MRHAKRFLIPLVCLVACFGSVSAQSSRTFKTRLSPVPIDVAMQATIAGTGTVTAVLSGSKLSITGSFEGLKSPATTAQVHRSPVRGVRGPVAFDLAASVFATASGTLTGTVDLTPPQVADLEKGRLYVLVHSEKAPDGNLWGWLMPQESKR
jgi:hypothetical protein